MAPRSGGDAGRLALERAVLLARRSTDRALLCLLRERILRGCGGLRWRPQGRQAMTLRWVHCNAAGGGGRRVERGLVLRRLAVAGGRGRQRVCVYGYWRSRGCPEFVVLALTLIVIVYEVPEIHLSGVRLFPACELPQLLCFPSMCPFPTMPRIYFAPRAPCLFIFLAAALPPRLPCTPPV